MRLTWLLLMPLHAQRLDQVIDAARADTLDIRLLDHGHQGSLSTPPGLEQTRKEAPVAHSRHLQLNRAHPRIPGPFAIAVAIASSIGGALVPFGAEVVGELHLHQLLGQDAYPLAQKISLFHTCLAQHFGECHSQFVGHRVWLLSSGSRQSR
jgi:hypothetical protein